MITIRNGGIPMKGMITNIQRFSLTDGDGIRTTVFFKGCPLKCVWCHNPESHTAKCEIFYDAKKCIGCRLCEKACPSGAVTMEGGVARIDPSLCTGCGACVAACKFGVIHMA